MGRFVCVCVFFFNTAMFDFFVLSHGDFPKTSKSFTCVIDDGDSEFAIGTDVPFRNYTIPVPVRRANLSNLLLCQLSCVGMW